MEKTQALALLALVGAAPLNGAYIRLLSLCKSSTNRKNTVSRVLLEGIRPPSRTVQQRESKAHTQAKQQRVYKTAETTRQEASIAPPRQSVPIGKPRRRPQRQPTPNSKQSTRIV